MASIAGVTAADMIGNFARRSDAIVATDAGAEHHTVVYPVGRP